MPLLGLAALAAVAWFGLGMHRGLLLSSDVKSWCWPWGGVMPRAELQAPVLSDPVWQFVPWLRLARRELAAGRLPLWNPHQDGGLPLHANPMTALLSPFSWPPLLLGVERGWNLSLLLRLLVAAASAYVWLRDGRSRAAAALGAVCFALSGPFVAWLENPNTMALAPVPLLLLLGSRLVAGERAVHLAGFALVTCMVLLGGHPETALFAGVLVVVCLAAAAPAPRKLALLGLGGLLGGLLAAPALVPFAEYLGASRAWAGLDRESFVLPWSTLVRFVVPSFEAGNPVTTAVTVSVIGLGLAVAGAVGARRLPERRVLVLLSAAILVVCVDSPVARGLATATNLHWTRALIVLPLPLAALAAGGLDDLLRALAGRGRTRLAAALGPLVVVVAVGELVLAARGVHAVTDPADSGRSTPLLSRLAAVEHPFRVLPLHTFLPPNAATELGLDDVRGYDAMSPRGWREQREAMGRFSAAPTVTDVLEPWDLAPGGAALDFWNVEFLLVHPQLPHDAATLSRQAGLDLETVYEGPDGRLLRNRRVLPRVRVEGQGTAEIVTRTAGYWRVHATLATGGVLVVANPFFPGWRVVVDGHRVALDLAPGAPFRVPLDPGAHTVELRYRPLSLLIGVGLAVLACAVLLVLALRPARLGGSQVAAWP